MNGRRRFIGALGGALGAGALGVRAQGTDRVYKVAVLRVTSAPKLQDPLSGEVLIRRFLAAKGYVEGRNLQLELRYADGVPQRLPVLARDMVAQKVDVIVTVASAAARAALDATATVPIVLFGNFDPVREGLVQSLARPGRNATAVLITPEGTLGGKRLELLKAALPAARRIAVLEAEDPTMGRTQIPELQQAAAQLQLDLPVVSVRNRDMREAFDRIAATKADGVVVMADTYFMVDRKPVIAETLRRRIASMWEWREQAEEGGLMAYGTGILGRYERIAVAIDRILKGANPGELAVDQPASLGLTLNLATAKSIGLELPKSLVLRADVVS